MVARHGAKTSKWWQKVAVAKIPTSIVVTIVAMVVECKSGKLIAFTDHRYDGRDAILCRVLAEQNVGGKERHS